MALLFFDGFDHNGTGGSTWADGFKKWFYAYFAYIDGISGATPRTGTGYLRMTSGSSEAVTKTLPASGGAVVGVAFNFSGFSNSGIADILQIREGATVHMAVAVDTMGKLSVKCGTTVLATGTTTLALNNWYYLEFKTLIATSTGSYELRIDTTVELTNPSVTTRNGGATGQWDRARISAGNTANSVYADDVYVCDTSGAAPRNTFLGPVKVETLYPQTDAVGGVGANVGLTPSTGTDHGALVDEPSPNTTDYNSSATVGAKDTYNYPPLALTGAVLGIQTNLFVAKSDAAARQVCAVVRAGGVDYDGANVSPGTTFSYFSEVRAQNPNTSADWTTTDIGNLQAGMKVTV